ncbi:hypothetical protein MTYP_02863 [Methylophilaceae bacterium]|nr:hypothetical protein MTYP_02863 [Methylophilaceae bacterium]
MVWDPNSGKLYPRDITGSEKGSKMSGKGLANSIIKDGKKAEILGKWFSKNDLQTIASYLKVVF